jgi:hypothetical protein
LNSSPSDWTSLYWRREYLIQAQVASTKDRIAGSFPVSSRRPFGAGLVKTGKASFQSWSAEFDPSQDDPSGRIYRKRLYKSLPKLPWADLQRFADWYRPVGQRPLICRGMILGWREELIRTNPDQKLEALTFSIL